MKRIIVTLTLSILVGSAPDAVPGQTGTTGNANDEARFDFTVSSRSAEIDLDLPPSVKQPGSIVKLLYKLQPDSTWQTLTHNKLETPIRVKFDKEGSYLVKVRPETHGTAATVPGSEKSYRCLVDWTRPVADTIDANHIAERLIVNWLAFDQHFPTEPIRLYFVNKDGQTLLAKSTNSGWADLELDPALLPGRLKLTAHDLAGNTAYVLSKPIPYGAILAHEKRHRLTLAKSTRIPTTKPAADQPRPEPVPDIPAGTTKPSEKTIPDDAKRQYRIATAYRLSGQLDLAQSHYRQAILLAPRFIEPNVDLAGVLNTARRYNDAEKYYRQALSIDRNCTEAWQGLGLVRVRQGNVPKAKQCFEKLTAINGTNVQAWIYLGDACWMLGQRIDASKSWQTARQMAETQHLKALVHAASQRCNLANSKPQ